MLFSAVLSFLVLLVYFFVCITAPGISLADNAGLTSTDANGTTCAFSSALADPS